MTCSVGCQTVVVSPDKMRSVTRYHSHSLTWLLLLLLPCLAQELARHRALGAVTRVSYSDHGSDHYRYGSRPRRVIIRRKVVRTPSHRTNTVVIPAERPL